MSQKCSTAVCTLKHSLNLLEHRDIIERQGAELHLKQNGSFAVNHSILILAFQLSRLVERLCDGSNSVHSVHTSIHQRRW